MNYYNENDPKAAAWLHELIKEGLIPDGKIDERSIDEVQPADLAGFAQCHFFAGIGGWPYALQLAGVPDGFVCWTGSCPCQPLSVAGKRGGESDERHLWPAFERLIAKCQPPIVFGEQIASKDGREWLAGVFADLETLGYAVAGADLCAAGLASPHIRQRLFWVADAYEQNQSRWRIQRSREGTKTGDGAARERFTGLCTDGGVANADQPGHTPLRVFDPQQTGQAGLCQSVGGVENREWVGRGGRDNGDTAGDNRALQTEGSSPVDWSRSVWWPCRDGKWRRVPARWVADTVPAGRTEGRAGPGGGPATGGGDDGGVSDAASPELRQEPSTGDEFTDRCDSEDVRGHERLEVEPALFPLADGVPEHVGLLRGAGNAIAPQVAAEFVKSILSVGI